MKLERNLRAVSLFPYVQGMGLSPLLEKNTELGKWPSFPAHFPSQDFGIWHSLTAQEEGPEILKIRVKFQAVFATQEVPVQALVDHHPQEPLRLYGQGTFYQSIRLIFWEAPALPSSCILKTQDKPFHKGQVLYEKSFLTQTRAVRISYERRTEESLWVDPPGRENIRVYWGYGGLPDPSSTDRTDVPSLFFAEQVFFTPLYQQGRTVIQQAFGKTLRLEKDPLQTLTPFLIEDISDIRLSSLAEDLVQGFVRLMLVLGTDSKKQDLFLPYQSVSFFPYAPDIFEIHFHPP